MSVVKISAFISSTSDLNEEREAVKEVCNMLKVEPFDYKVVPANSASPESLLRKEIGRAEIFIGVLGGKYGSLYPPQNDRSVVEFEFEEARGRPPDYLTAVFPKVLPPDNVEEPQEKFRKRISDIRGIWVKTFDSVEKLKNEVRDSITHWLADFYITYKQAEEPAMVKDHRKVIGMAGLLAGIAVLGSLLTLISPPLQQPIQLR